MVRLTQKMSATLQAVLLFFLISNPFTYRLTNSLLGGLTGRLADPSGCPTTIGILLHSVVFGMIVYALMWV
jgi:hypothetical protein